MLVKGAKGIHEIGHSLDAMFHAQTEHKKKKEKKTATTRTQQILKNRAGDEGYDDDTAVGAVANDVIEQRQMEANRDALAREIDRKWGKGTWAAILLEQEKRVADKAEREKKAKENALRKKKEDKIFWHHVLVEIGKGVLVVLFAGLMVGFVYWAATAPKIR
tara:strand:+ start:137 stop:622 length:486 start_codon:yes stop_codon:yes gene_type:complete